jgi:hypothetical protein
MPRLDHLLLAGSIAAVAAVAACDDDGPTGGPETFTASFTSATTAAPGGRCPALTVAIAGPGTASPGGSFTTLQSHCIDPAGANPGLFSDGIFTFTYTGGDQVSGTYQGQLVPTADPAVFTIDGEFAISDGTGEFDGATGGGDAAGEANLATGDSSLELTGTIDR